MLSRFFMQNLLDSVKAGPLETGPQMHKDFLGKKVCLSAGCVSGDGRNRERGGEGVKTVLCTHNCTQALTVFYIKNCAWYHEEHPLAVLTSPTEPGLGYFLDPGYFTSKC